MKLRNFDSRGHDCNNCGAVDIWGWSDTLCMCPRMRMRMGAEVTMAFLVKHGQCQCYGGSSGQECEVSEINEIGLRCVKSEL